MINWLAIRLVMQDKLFCYGTLCLPAVMRLVCGRVPPARSASLDGYSLVDLDGRLYPGIRPAADAGVSGLLYDGLSRTQLARLDAYEGGEYRRCVVRVATAQGQRQLAWTYVLQPRYYYLARSGNWSLERFAREELALYLYCHHNKLAGHHGRNPIQST